MSEYVRTREEKSSGIACCVMSERYCEFPFLFASTSSREWRR